MPQAPERHVRIQAILAFIFVFWLSLFVITIVLIGALEVEPRRAALFALAPAAALGGLSAAIRPLRRLFGHMFMLG